MAKRTGIGPDTPSAKFTALERLVSGLDLETIPVVEIPLERIRENPAQPRSRRSSALSEESIAELARSIEEHGLLQPIIVKNAGRYYHLIAGERRFMAFKLLGRPTIPARVIQVTDPKQELEISLIENLQRHELDPVEEARALKRLMDEFGYSYRQLAERLGKSVGYVDSRLKLLVSPDLEEAVQQMEVGVAEARELAKVEDQALRKDLTRRVVSGELDREQLKDEVRRLTGKALDPQSGVQRIRKALQSLQRALDLAGQISLDEDTLRLAEKAADRLILLLRSVSTVRPRASGPTFRHTVGESQSASLSPRDVAYRVRQMRDAGGYSLQDRILAFWRQMDRAGRHFQLGPWECIAKGEDTWTVRLRFSLDGSPAMAEWEYISREGLLQPVNDEARALGSGGLR
jgi:ParB family chromosome partitioning protein